MALLLPCCQHVFLRFGVRHRVAHASGLNAIVTMAAPTTIVALIFRCTTCSSGSGNGETSGTEWSLVPCFHAWRPCCRASTRCSLVAANGRAGVSVCAVDVFLYSYSRSGPRSVRLHRNMCLVGGSDGAVKLDDSTSTFLFALFCAAADHSS